MGFLKGIFRAAKGIGMFKQGGKSFVVSIEDNTLIASSIGLPDIELSKDTIENKKLVSPSTFIAEPMGYYKNGWNAVQYEIILKNGQSGQLFLVSEKATKDVTSLLG